MGENKTDEKENGHPGTAPKGDETEDADRMEGSFEPRTSNSDKADRSDDLGAAESENGEEAE